MVSQQAPIVPDNGAGTVYRIVAPKKGAGENESVKRDKLQRIPAAVPDRGDCVAYLFEQRWPNGSVCHKCGAGMNSADAGNMSASIAIGNARLRRGLFCTAPIFH